MKKFNYFSLVIVSAFLISACSTAEKKTVAPTETPKPTPVTPAATPRTVATVVAPTVDPLLDPKGVLAKRSIYFEYDSYIVKEEFKTLIEAHAKYLSINKSRKILIQGNADKRGGREYNLALGQKRAEAVRKSLSLLGAAESQMEAVSLGKEKPKALGSNEAAWAENRRSDIVY
jgi:peptidoglycan-associated lipoprotein